MRLNKTSSHVYSFNVDRAQSDCAHIYVCIHVCTQIRHGPRRDDGPPVGACGVMLTHARHGRHHAPPEGAHVNNPSPCIASIYCYIDLVLIPSLYRSLQSARRRNDTYGTHRVIFESICELDGPSPVHARARTHARILNECWRHAHRTMRSRLLSNQDLNEGCQKR